jgi:hypothetical protein
MKDKPTVFRPRLSPLWRFRGLRRIASGGGPAFFLALGLSSPPAQAIDDIYQTQEAFLAEAFGAKPPPPQLLDLNGGVLANLNSILVHPYAQSRVRYWRAGGKSAWVLDTIGKEGYQPTTAGFVVKDGAIAIARVLIYRESRGEQIAQPSFLQQFTGARTAGEGLSKPIDGISGATYSVKMMQRMARAAIALDAAAP